MLDMVDRYDLETAIASEATTRKAADQVLTAELQKIRDEFRDYVVALTDSYTLLAARVDDLCGLHPTLERREGA